MNSRDGDNRDKSDEALVETITPAEATALDSSDDARAREQAFIDALGSGETMTPAEAAAATKSVERRPQPGVLPEIARATYAVRRELARGGMGRILVADDSRLGRRVALKELIAKDRGLQRRFDREVRITAKLQHPGIVPVYEAGHWPDGEPFYAMKLVAGTSLEKVVDNKPELEDRLRLLPNLVQLAEAIAYAHGNGVIHRDLKPANVLVGDYGETVVIDWGLAKEIREADDDDGTNDSLSPSATGMTMSGAVVGTPAYMPPEQAHGDAVGSRADVYSLGALMWHVLAGRPPYQGKVEQVLEQVRTRPPPRLQDVAPGIPAELASIVEHAMERDPDLRYPTARELAEELSRFQTGQLVTRHVYTTWQLVKRWVKRHRAAVMSAAALLVGASVVGVIAMRKVVAERDRAHAVSLAALVEEGRRELVDGHPLRASVYFAAAYRAGRNDESLRLMLGEAMRGVDASVAAWTSGAWITHLAWASKDQLLAVADNGAVTVWDLAAGTRAEVPGDKVQPIAVAIADDGSRLALLGETSLRIIDLGTRTATIVKLAKFAPKLVTILDDGAVAVEGGTGVRVFGPDGSERSRDAEAPPVTFKPPLGTYAANGSKLIQVIDDEGGSATAFDVSNGTSHEIGRRDERDVYTVAAIDRGAARLAAGTAEGIVRLWDVHSGVPVISVDGHTRSVRALAFDPTSARLASAGDDGVVRIWDLASSSFNPAEASAAPGELAAASTDGRVRVVARRNEVVVGTLSLRGLDEVVSWLDVAPDGATVVAGARDGRAMRWDAASGRPLDTWELTSAVTAGDIARDGTVALGMRDGSARIVHHGADAIRLEGHASPVHALAWHPARDELLSAADTAVRVWTGGGTLLRYLSAGESVGRAWWAANGNWIVVDGESSLQIWDGAHGTLLVRLSHGLTPELVAPIGGPIHGARDDAGAIARSGMHGFVAWPLPRETRAASIIAASIEKQVPWRLAGSELVPASGLVTVRSEDASRGPRKTYDFAGETIQASPSQPSIPLTLNITAVAEAMRAIQRGDRDAARTAVASATGTKDPRNAYEVAWCWHYIGDDNAAFSMAMRAWSGWTDAATKPKVLADVLRLAAWAEISHDAVVAALGTDEGNKARLSLAQAYDELARFALVTPTIEKMSTNADEWPTRLRGLYLMARRAYLRGDLKLAVEDLEIAARAIPAGKLPTVTLAERCADRPAELPPLDPALDAGRAVADLTQALARDSFLIYSRAYDYRFALVSRRLYALLADKFGVAPERVGACTNELDAIAANSIGKLGDLDKSLLRNAFAQQHTALITCYQRELDSNPSIEGTVSVRLDISTNGTISSVETYPEPETPAMQSLATCVQTAISHLNLPRQTFGSRVTAHYPLTFTRATK